MKQNMYIYCLRFMSSGVMGPGKGKYGFEAWGVGRGKLAILRPKVLLCLCVELPTSPAV